ncbi:MAG: hypothetical protein KTV68_18715 [Acidimicrobiia bacterium]|nr:hypothetical protein [Acidimicrobiia bacterium]
MSTQPNAGGRRLIPFTINGVSYETDDLSQEASDLLKLAGLDPAGFDLGEVSGKEHLETKWYHDNEKVEIHKDARFVSRRQSAPVA